jgi:hypothetical protein
VNETVRLICHLTPRILRHQALMVTDPRSRTQCRSRNLIMLMPYLACAMHASDKKPRRLDRWHVKIIPEGQPPGVRLLGRSSCGGVGRYCASGHIHRRGSDERRST